MAPESLLSHEQEILSIPLF